MNVLKLWMIYFQEVSHWWFLNFSSWDTIFCVHFFPFSVFLLRQFCDSAFSWCYVFSKVWKVNWPGLSGVAQECWSLKCGGVLQTAQIIKKKNRTDRNYSIHLPSIAAKHWTPSTGKWTQNSLQCSFTIYKGSTAFTVFWNCFPCVYWLKAKLKTPACMWWSERPDSTIKTTWVPLVVFCFQFCLH